MKNNQITEKVYAGRPQGTTSKAKYAEVIDVLAPIHGEKEDQVIFSLDREYYSKFVLEATSKVQFEKYEITIEGSNLIIGNMPKMKLKLKLI